jgi:LPS export ABC transporter protein LptC
MEKVGYSGRSLVSPAPYPVIKAMKRISIALPRTRAYIAGIGIAAFLGVIIVLTLNLSLPRGRIPEPELPASAKNADMQFQKIHYTSTNDQGIKEWELTATTANYFRDKKLAEFENVDVTFYYKQGRVFTLRGDIGRLNMGTKDITLTGNVIGTSNDGYRFQTQSLVYNAQKRQAQTDDKALVEGPQFNLEGTGMIVDIEKEKVFLLSEVRARGKK